MTNTIRVFDLEANGWSDTADTIWCIATYDIGTRREEFFEPHQIEEGLRYLMDADVCVAHNLLGYDYPLIKRLYPWFNLAAYEDSLILSRMFTPDRPSGHSIDAWAAKCGKVKPPHDDFSQYSEAMRVRCIEDTRINAAVLRMLQNEMGTENWSESIRTEYLIQILQSEQERRGFPFDKKKAEQNLTMFRDKQAAIMDKLMPQLPPKIKQGTTYKAPFTKAGKINHHVANWVPEELHHTISGPFTGVVVEPFNLNSPPQVNKLLLDNGWVPQEFNYVKKKGGGYELERDGSYKISSPKITKDHSCLESVTGELGKLIVDERVIRSRMGNIFRVTKDGTENGWLTEIRDDGTVVGGAIPMGTPTSRYTHFGIVNVPRPSTLYGGELRELFIAPEGQVIVGTDGAGLEARVAGHYTAAYDGGEFARELMEGDIHSKNAAAFTEAVQFEVDRGAAKNLYYATIYGATSRKLASMLGVSAEIAEHILNTFWEVNPALASVRDAAQKQAKRKGYLVGLDGRRIPCRSKHSAMNYEFQSAGAIIMKRAFIKAFLEQTSDPLDYWDANHPMIKWRCLLTMHDETQAAMDAEYVDEHVNMWTGIGEEITSHFNLNIPIEFDSKVGNNWKETH